MNESNTDVDSFKIKTQPYYLAQDNEIELFRLAYKEKIPMILKGPTGSGKTRLVKYMAYNLELPLYTIACHEDLTASDLVGRYIIKGDQVEWLDGLLLTAVKNGGIFYLDEVVEARKDVTVLIHPLTDDRRILPVDKLGRQFQAPDNFMLVVSYNPNYQSLSKELKPSTKQRFVSKDLGWPKSDIEIKIITHESGVDEETAKKLVQCAGEIRNLQSQGLEEGVSTRELVYAGQLIKNKMLLNDALYATMIEPLTNDADMKKSIREVLANVFDLGDKSVKGKRTNR